MWESRHKCNRYYHIVVATYIAVSFFLSFSFLFFYSVLIPFFFFFKVLAAYLFYIRNCAARTCFILCAFFLREQGVYAPGLTEHRCALDASGDIFWEAKAHKQQGCLQQHGAGNEPSHPVNASFRNIYYADYFSDRSWANAVNFPLFVVFRVQCFRVK